MESTKRIGLLKIIGLFLFTISVSVSLIARRGGGRGHGGARMHHGRRMGGRHVARRRGGRYYHRRHGYPRYRYRRYHPGWRYGGWYGYRPGFWLGLGYPLFASGPYYNYVRQDEWNRVSDDLKDQIRDLRDQLEKERNISGRIKLKKKIAELHKHEQYAEKKVGELEK